MEYHDLKFVVSDPMRRFLNYKHAIGRTSDVSENGVGLITEFPVEEGHKIVVLKNGAKPVPHIMLVQWSKKFNGDQFRAGLSYVDDASIKTDQNI